MGDRYIYFYDCPKCGLKNGVEVYDAPSCILFSEHCNNPECDFRGNRDYYEVDHHGSVELLTPEQAKAKGIIPYDERSEED